MTQADDRRLAASDAAPRPSDVTVPTSGPPVPSAPLTPPTASPPSLPPPAPSTPPPTPSTSPPAMSPAERAVPSLPDRPLVPPPARPDEPASTMPETAIVHVADSSSAHATPFTPLRSSPPPRLFATWWLRYLLVLSLLVGIAVVLLREYAVAGGMREAFVVIPHVMAAMMLVGWSALAMLDAARLVPASRYHHRARASVAVVLWLGAFASPAVAVAVFERVRERFENRSDELLPAAIVAAAVLVCFVLVWLPFRYHVRQAHRIGAPVRVMIAWFWLPLVAAVGVLAVTALGLHDTLAEDGYTDLERTVQVAVLYGVPALMFAMATWRATTVFDEVIELRWMRWRNEWEQTLVAFAAQPPPGPEGSPDISAHQVRGH